MSLPTPPSTMQIGAVDNAPDILDNTIFFSKPSELTVRFIRVTFGGTSGCTTGCGPYAVTNILAQRIDATFSRLFFNETDMSSNQRGLNVVRVRVLVPVVLCVSECVCSGVAQMGASG